MGKNIIVASNLIKKDGKYLVVKEIKEKIKGKYNFPSGHQDNNETLIECAIRETKEESGLNIKPSKIVALFQIPTTKSKNNLLMVVFKSEIISGELTTSEKHPEVKFVSLEEIKKLEKNNLIRHGDCILSAINRYENNESINLDFLKIF